MGQIKTGDGIVPTPVEKLVMDISGISDPEAAVRAIGAFVDAQSAAKVDAVLTSGQSAVVEALRESKGREEDLLSKLRGLEGEVNSLLTRNAEIVRLAKAGDQAKLQEFLDNAPPLPEPPAPTPVEAKAKKLPAAKKKAAAKKK